MKKAIIDIDKAEPRQEQFRFQEPVSWKIGGSEYWAVIGPNGAGKALLIDLLLGKFALKSGEIRAMDDKGDIVRVSSIVKSVAFRDIYSLVDTQNSYYQQRWNKGLEQDVAIVSDLVADADKEWLSVFVDWFGVSDLMNKKIDLLSSGELRKFLIIRALLSRPKVLILDNPFIGLDSISRNVLNELLLRLERLEGLQVILVLSNPKDIPDGVTHILPVGNKMLYPAMLKNDFLEDHAFINTLFKNNNNYDVSGLITDSKKDNGYENAAILKNIHIKYGERTILKGLDWKIKRGEKWALLGANGSGKSPLLSLICGDNPQAYANDIALFDRKRGTGESIWDIKKRIGYISPEMHLYYLKNVSCIDVVGSGFFDTIGLYRKCNAEQERMAYEWMKIFGVEHLKNVSFLHVSSGEQRLVLLARVFVKNPDLLILDEPLHGLDFVNKKMVKKIIENFCTPEKSLIYVTHYEEEIPEVVTQRLVLEKL